ncbi:MAG: hypothetical protein C5B56_15825 [Proteobacteria bacterium]|nr:MAG: hypothetical protein C5B56_15825 [Pseudomonadota bacterium]
MKIVSSIASVFCLAVAPLALAQRGPEFSADMVTHTSSGGTETDKLYVGLNKVRLDRLPVPGSVQHVKTIIIDGDNQVAYLLVPDQNAYVKSKYVAGMALDGVTLFRPVDADNPCAGWVDALARNNIELECKKVGVQPVDDRPTVKWDGTTSRGGTGAIWYDPSLHFVVKLQENPTGGPQSGYQLKNVVFGPPAASLFVLPSGYHEISWNQLAQIVAGS